MAVISERSNSNPGATLLSGLKAAVDSFPDHQRKEVISAIRSVIRTVEPILHPGEGNAFEADVVAGVESAGNNDEGEVRTREVPEDDVPGEYLDKE